MKKKGTPISLSQVVYKRERDPRRKHQVKSDVKMVLEPEENQRDLAMNREKRQKIRLTQYNVKGEILKMVKLNFGTRSDVSRIIWTDTIAAAQRHYLCVYIKIIIYKYRTPRQKQNKNRIQFTFEVAIKKRLKKWCTERRGQFDVTRNAFRTDIKMTAVKMQMQITLNNIR